MNDTVFGKIIRGEIPITKVYEDDKCLAFLDVRPVTKGHVLLIPKEQYRWMYDTPDETLAYLIIKAKQIMKGMVRGIPCNLVQIDVAGEEVAHFHIHLIPRMHGQDLGDTHPGSSYENLEEMQLFAEKIKKELI